MIGTVLIGTSTIAQVWTEDFEDPNWFLHWQVTNAIWEVGSPTVVGPTSVISGSNCAATVVNGNYPTGADSHFRRITPFVVPPADQDPRLRFWHWYSMHTFFGADEASIEISVSGGPWQVLQTWTNYGAGWTNTSVDLKPYAGDTVRIGFWIHDVIGTVSYVSSGWYIDDIELVAGPVVLNNPEGFETDLGDWYAESGAWQVGAPTSGPMDAHTGTQCAATVLDGNYNTGMDARLISPEFTVPPVDSLPALIFWQWFSFETFFGTDYGQVEIRTRTSGWQPLGIPFTVFSGDNWYPANLSLEAYSDSVVQLAFHAIDSIGNVSYVSAGWYIDDVRIIGLLPTGIDQQAPTQHLDVSPNPFDESITIDLGPFRDPDNLTISDHFGRPVRSLRISAGTRITWDGRTSSGTEVPPGMYFVTVISDGQRYTQRVIKQ